MDQLYCTYLTSYFGNKLPPFYIGYTTVANINRGYRGRYHQNHINQYGYLN